jgi:hypothetical protein
MKVITPGHTYELDHFENGNEGYPFCEHLHFIEKVPAGEGSNELTTVHDGTTNEEVLRVLIDRMNYLHGKFSCRENAIVITKLEECLMWLNKRTDDRKARNVEGKQIA